MNKRALQVWLRQRAFVMGLCGNGKQPEGSTCLFSLMLMFPVSVWFIVFGAAIK